MSKVYEASLEQFEGDKRNANKGTVRGKGMLDKSVRKLGAGRSIVVDKHGRIIAGNKTRQAMVEAGITQARVVETDGKELVVVKRIDLDLDEGGAARELAYADNRVGEVDLQWDHDVILEDTEIVSDWFTDPELAAMGAEIEDQPVEWDGMPEFAEAEKRGFRTIIVHFANQEGVDEFQKLVRQEISERAKFIWFPKLERREHGAAEYDLDDDASEG